MSVHFSEKPPITTNTNSEKIQKPKATKATSVNFAKTAASTANSAVNVDCYFKFEREDKKHLTDWQWDNVQNLQAAQDGVTENVVSSKPDGECVIQ